MKLHILPSALGVLSISLATCAGVASAHPEHATAPAVGAYDPVGKTPARIESDLRSGNVTSTSLVRAYLTRIAAYNHAGPAINAVIQLDPDAVSAARASDQRRHHGRALSPLEGIPVLIKANIDVKGLTASGGSLALLGNRATRDAPAVARLRAAGAVIMGTTNMSELAASYGRLGYSSVGGLTINPIDTLRNASGSSSGSAASLAADFATIALGTDTSGSVRGPASAVGLVGLRPTRGAIPTGGVIPVSNNLDAVGIMAHDTTAVAQTYDTLTNTRGSGQMIGTTLKGRRVGVVDAFNSANPAVAAASQRTSQLILAAGGTAVPVMLSSAAQYAWTPVVGPLSDLDFAHDINAYLATRTGRTPRTLDSIITILESSSATSSPNPPNPARVAGLQQSQDDAAAYGGIAYQTAVDTGAQLRQEMTRTMTANHLDAISYPTMECPASPLYTVTDATYECNSTDEYSPAYIASATGLPEITYPSAIDSQGLPIGMSLLGRAHSEASLIGLAATLQSLSAAHPKVTATPPLR